MFLFQSSCQAFCHTRFLFDCAGGAHLMLQCIMATCRKCSHVLCSSVPELIIKKFHAAFQTSSYTSLESLKWKVMPRVMTTSWALVGSLTPLCMTSWELVFKFTKYQQPRASYGLSWVLCQRITTFFSGGWYTLGQPSRYGTCTQATSLDMLIFRCLGSRSSRLRQRYLLDSTMSSVPSGSIRIYQACTNRPSQYSCYCQYSC